MGRPTISFSRLDDETQKLVMGNNNNDEVKTKKKVAKDKKKIEAEATVAKDKKKDEGEATVAKDKEKDEAEAIVAEDKGMILSPERKEMIAADAAARASRRSSLMIFVLMVFLALTIGLFRLDFKKGDLQEIKAQLPPEIHDALEKAENVSRDLNAKVRELYIKAMVKVEELSSHVFSKEKPKVEGTFVLT